MNPRQRVERIHAENFLDSVAERATLSEKQEATLADIETKIFGEE